MLILTYAFFELDDQLVFVIRPLDLVDLGLQVVVISNGGRAVAVKMVYS